MATTDDILKKYKLSRADVGLIDSDKEVTHTPVKEQEKVTPKDYWNMLTSPAVPLQYHSEERKKSINKILGKPSERIGKAFDRFKQVMPDPRRKGETDEQFAERMTDAGMFWAIRMASMQTPKPPNWVPKSGVVDARTPNIPAVRPNQAGGVAPKPQVTSNLPAAPTGGGKIDITQDTVFVRPEHYGNGAKGIGKLEDSGSKDRPLLQNKNKKSIVYRDKSGKPQGVVSFAINEEGGLETRPDYGGNVEVYVNPKFRRKGIATQLYDKARKLGYDLDSVEGQVYTEEGAELFKSRQATPTGATPKQTQKIHAIAQSKGFINSKGKTKPQYKRLAEAMTGKKSVAKMTPEEAFAFESALNKLPEPRVSSGKIIPPSIPTGSNLVPQDFFDRNFKKPSTMSALTSQSRTADLIGVKSLVQPFESAKIEMAKEYSKNLTPLNQALKKTKKIVGTEKMALALNTSEEAPAGLTGKSKDLFDYFRGLSRKSLAETNAVNKSLGLPEIKGIQGYYRHMADTMTDDIMGGKYPPPEGSKYWSEKTVSKNQFNPMALRRTVKDDLLERFSKDLDYVTKSMLWTAAKVKHFAIPKHILNKELGLLSKDQANYKNLSPAEQKLFDANATIPAETKKWLIDYVNITLMGRQSPLDKQWNNLVTETPLGKLFDKGLKLFGKRLSQKPVTNMISKASMAPIYGVMGGVRPKQLIRNKFQTVQNMALYGVKNTVKGFLPTGSNPTLERLKGKSQFLESYSGFEDLPINLKGKIQKLALSSYQWSALSNVNQAMNTAYYWTANKIQNPKFKGHGWADPQRTYKEPKNFLYPSEEAIALKEMEYGAQTAQYGYLSMHMPGLFRNKSMSGITRLQSWWMNHYFTFHREAMTRAFTGRVGYDPKLKVTVGDRFNYLKYLLIGGMILNTLGYEKSFLFGAAPSSLPPTAQAVLSLYTILTNLGDEPYEKRKRSSAKKRFRDSMLTFIPGYLSLKDANAFTNALLDGDKSWKDFFFYTKEKAKNSKKSSSRDIDVEGILSKY